MPAIDVYFGYGLDITELGAANCKTLMKACWDQDGFVKIYDHQKDGWYIFGETSVLDVMFDAEAQTFKAIDPIKYVVEKQTANNLIKWQEDIKAFLVSNGVTLDDSELAKCRWYLVCYDG